jgi:Putative phage tail protein
MAFFGSAPKQTQQSAPPAYNALRVQQSSYGVVIKLIYGTVRVSGNILDADDFRSIAHSSGGGGGSGGSKGGGGGGGGGGSTSYTYDIALLIGLGSGPINDIGRVWKGKDITSLPQIASSATVLKGALGQDPWGYLTSFHPDKALGYSGIAAIGLGNADLGDSPDTPNYGFEVLGMGPAANAIPVDLSYTLAFPTNFDFGSGVINILFGQLLAAQPPVTVTSSAMVYDTNPGFVIADLLLSKLYGVGWPAGRLGDLSAYTTWCQAAGLLVSLTIEESTTAADFFDNLLRTTNATLVWSGGVLKIVPLADSAVTGTKVDGSAITFTPDLTPKFSFNDDDYVVDNPEDPPVTRTFKDPADVYNQQIFECVERADSYNIATVTAEDEAMIATFGQRPGPAVKAHHFASSVVAMQAALLLRDRVINIEPEQIKFKVGAQWVRIEPGDIGMVTDSFIGLVNYPVLVRRKTEDAAGNLSIEAEPAPGALSVISAMPVQQTSRYQPNYNVDPGPVTDALFLDAPTELAGSGLEIWMLACGGPQWGGCEIHISSTGDTYKKVGAYRGNSTMGTLTAPLASGVDPDTTHALAVDLSESRGQVLGGTKADADSFHTLAVVDGELVAYETATLTGPNCYSLGYLRRGLYGTTIAAHGAGAKFGRLDGNFYFPYAYTPDQIGSTIWVKLVSFNTFDGAIEDISTVTAHQVIIQGPPLPPTPLGFSAVQNGAVVAFGWIALTDYAIDIAVGPQGCTTGVSVDQAWSAMSMVTEAARGTEMTNAAIQPGAWTFGIRARNPVSGQLSSGMTTINLTVTNAQTVVITAPQAPGWAGSVSGFVRHHTGVLIPDSTLLANQVTAAEAAASFIPAPVAVSTYTSPVIDTGVVDQIRVWATIQAALGPGGAGNVNTSLGLDWSVDGVHWAGVYQPWTVGTAMARYIKAQLSQDNSAGACVITGFTITADCPSKTDVGTGASASPVTVAAGGTVITFTQPFHFPPNVQTTAQGAGMTGASAINVTTTGCTLHGWTGGTDSGGPVSWKATGP